mmetsp:Transcript_137438/g.357175  ORF Transcript_137438/g.357175 Transcript_137438/m.357175 type:complete len:243 (-) Transcript_137438:104-832(-)
MVDIKAAVSEGLAMFMFVTIGCGIACAHGTLDAMSRLIVAFAFGIGILVLAYGFAHHSGAQINCAVTFALIVGGVLPVAQGCLNIAGQLVGSVLGACFLCLIFPCDADKTSNLGSNLINYPAYGYAEVFLCEVFGTFLLCYTVFETAVNPKANVHINYGVAIGLSVFLAHLILLPLDGCSINPTRSIGPALVGSIRDCTGGSGDQGLEDLWMFIGGPMIGAGIAGGVKIIIQPEPRKNGKGK